MASQVQIVISVDDKGAISALQQMGSQVNKLGPSLEKAGSQGGVVFTKLSGDTQRAHDAAALFSRTLGIELPRQLERFLASSKSVGPLLSTAFNASVFAGFGLAIADLLLKIPGLISQIEDWISVDKVAVQAQKDVNSVLVEQSKNLRELQLQYRLIGLEGLHLMAGKQAEVNEKLGEARKRLAAVGKELQDFQAVIKSQQGTREAIRGLIGLPDQSDQWLWQSMTKDQAERLAQIQNAYSSASNEVQIWTQALRNSTKELGSEENKKAFEDRLAELQAANEFLKNKNSLFQGFVQAQMDALLIQGKGQAESLEKSNELERHRIELVAQTKIETSRIEQEAAVAILPPWERAYAEIVLRNQERVEQIHSQLDGLKGAEALSARQIAAANAVAAAEMRDKMASEIEGLFDDITSGNIGRRFQQMFKHQVAEMVASWILGLNGMRQSSAGIFGGGAASGSGGILGAIFGGLLGGRANTGAATPPFFPLGSASAASALPLSMLAPGAFSQGGGITGTGLGSGFDLFGMGSPIGPGGTAPFNGPISGSGAGAGSTLPSGATVGSPLLAATHSLKIGGLTIPAGVIGSLGLLLGLQGISSSRPASAGIMGALGGFGIGFSGALSGLPGFSGASGLLGGLVGATIVGGIALGVSGIRSGNILAGTAGGALAGLAIGGPIGAVIGGIIGLIGSLFGSAARRRKREALEQEVIAQAKKIEDAYKVFQLDYNSANAQLEQLRADEIAKLAQIGSRDKSTQDRRVNRHIDETEKEIQAFEAERARRMQLISSLPLPEFATGGFVNARRPGGPVMALLHDDEAVLNPRARAALGDRAIDALNRGQSPGSVAPANVTVGPIYISVVAPQGMDMRKLSQEIGRRLESTLADRGLSFARAR
jgi:hypothetical protein